jgi:hypothetical protein
LWEELVYDPPSISDTSSGQTTSYPVFSGAGDTLYVCRPNTAYVASLTRSVTVNVASGATQCLQGDCWSRVSENGGYFETFEDATCTGYIDGFNALDMCPTSGTSACPFDEDSGRCCIVDGTFTGQICKAGHFQDGNNNRCVAGFVFDEDGSNGCVQWTPSLGVASEFIVYRTQSQCAAAHPSHNPLVGEYKGLTLSSNLPNTDDYFLSPGGVSRDFIFKEIGRYTVYDLILTTQPCNVKLEEAGDADKYRILLKVATDNVNVTRYYLMHGHKASHATDDPAITELTTTKWYLVQDPEDVADADVFKVSRDSDGVIRVFSTDDDENPLAWSYSTTIKYPLELIKTPGEIGLNVLFPVTTHPGFELRRELPPA